MTDATTIRAAADELLHAHASMSAEALAGACTCTVREVVVALSESSRFTRVAGAGCWWWARCPLADLGTHKRRRTRSDGTATRAWRKSVADRERIRGTLRSDGPQTAKRLAERLGLAGAEVADLLRGLEALGDVTAYRLPGIPDLQFWKERAA